jgi:hypothetical protein
MATFDFITYFRNVATTLKDILHSADNQRFHRISSLPEMEEFLANSRSNSGYHLIVLDKPSGRLDDSSNSDNLIDRKFYTFYILKNVANADYDEAETIRQQCLTSARKIMSKMFLDKRNSANSLLDLDRSSIYYDTIGPIAHGYMGIMCSFSLYNSAGIIYDSDDWN